MEVSYGIGVTNRYALFYDENEDPLDIIQQTDKKEAPKKSDKDVKASKTPDVKDKKAPQAPVNGQPKKGPTVTSTTAKPQDQIKPKEEGKAPGGKPPQNRDRNVRFPNENREPREERNNRRNFDERGNREFPAPVRAEGEGGGFGGGDSGFRGRGAGPRNPGRGLGRGRARGRGGVPDNRGKREYERQSGSLTTGIKPVDKREGAGPHNWGSVKDDIEGQLDSTVVEEFTDWTKEVPEGETVAAEEPKAEAEGEEVAPVEEGPQELTLDEWKARQGERKKPEFNIRKPGEGEDNAQWKKTFALEKKKEAEEEEEEEEEDYTGDFPQRAGRQKRLDIDIRFADTRRGGPGGMRGGRGRGGPRGGRGFGGERGERPERGGFGGERGERPERGFGGERGERPERGGFGGERPERGGFGGERGERPEGGENPRRGGFRGGPRGGRGFGGGQGPRGGPTQQHAPKVDDENDFPALG